MPDNPSRCCRSCRYCGCRDSSFRYKSTTSAFVITTCFALLIVFKVLSSHVFAASPVREQSLVLPHAFGYQLGDTFEHRLRVAINRPYKLVQGSLPVPGRVSNYTQLLAVENRSGFRLWGAVHDISLRYQIINYSNKLVATAVPPVAVSFTSDTDIYPIVIEPWGFTVSPFLLSEDRVAGQMPVLQPLPQLPEIPFGWRWLKLIVLGTLAISGFAVLVSAYLLDPLLQKLSTPFAVAIKTVKQSSRLPDTPNGYQQALKSMHRAFDATLGRSMLPRDIDVFLAAHPAYRPCKEAIEEFFALSGECFFSDEQPLDDGYQSQFEQLQKIARQLVSRERRLAWSGSL